MEDDEVWETCLGFAPSEAGGLPAMLDAAAVAHCGLEVPESGATDPQKTENQ
jgi:hypothetical protein